MAKAGVKLPIHSYTLQAMVSEPVKPCLDIVVLHLGTGVYASQSDKGEIVFGGGLDRIPSYGQRGSPPMQELVLAGLLEMFPAFGQLKMMRQWGGIVDVVPDSSPIIGPAPTNGIFLNCGWGTGGFKAIPAAARCSRIFWRPARTTRSAAPSTCPASRRGASSTRLRDPASSIKGLALAALTPLVPKRGLDLILRSDAQHRVSKDGPARDPISVRWSVLRDAALRAALRTRASGSAKRQSP